MTDTTFATSVRIAARPDQVFPYLTDPSLIVRWMGEWAELEAEPGGGFSVDIGGVPIRGRYVLVEPPHRLVLTWGAAGHETMPAGSTTVDITLRADGDGTVVDLVHRDLPPDEQPKHEVGWGHFLPRLVTVAAGGDPGPDLWGPS
ncbi:MAG TPA: SRPBCC domain-containing protein [Acidimicrobiales bacterium]